MTRRRRVPLLKRYRLRFARRRPPAAMWEALIVLLFGAVLIYAYSFAKKVTFGAEATDPEPAIVVRVQVLNGCGEPGLAGEVADRLSRAGLPRYRFDPVDQGNFATFDVSETLVLDRGGALETAKEVATLLGVDPEHVLTQPLAGDVLDIEVTVLLGRDFTRLKLPRNERSP